MFDVKMEPLYLQKLGITESQDRYEKILSFEVRV